MDVQLTTNFKLSEFRCKCCRAVDQAAALQLARRLEGPRTLTGPMTIVSGYRCSKHNQLTGGKRNSQHLIGLAADILVTSDAQRHLLLSALLAFNFKRIGIGKSIIHADIGTITGPVIWTYYP
jgi:uncharacterized protein YcbK (DUF882 family)